MLTEKLQIWLGEFWHVGWVLVVLIAGISILTGFVREYIPQEKFQKKLKNRSIIGGSFFGAALGVLTPFCSASMVPVAMGMVEMGIPFSTIFSFILSAPLSNFVVVSIILGTFGWKIAAIYFVWTFCCAVIGGLTVGQSRIKNHVKNIAEIMLEKQRKSACSAAKVSSCCESAPNPVSSCASETAIPVANCSESASASCCGGVSRSVHTEKIHSAFRFALALFKQIVPYVIVGAAISGLALAFLPASIVERYVGKDAWYAIPVAAAIGVPLYLRIEMAIPLLSALLLKGMNMGAAIALLIGGTGASLPEIAILSAMLKPKAIIAFVLTVFVIACLGGVLFLVVL